MNQPTKIDVVPSTKPQRRRVKRAVVFVTVCAMTLLCPGCLVPPVKRPLPEIIMTGSPDDVTAQAVAIARADIADEKPMICHAGGRDPWPVGVPIRHRKLISKLPVWTLASDCRSPWLHSARLFAKAYNEEILRHIRGEASGGDASSEEIKDDR